MKNFSLTIVFLVVLGCGRSEMRVADEAGFKNLSRNVAQISDTEESNPSSVVDTRKRMLIKTGSLSMRVDDVKVARRKIGDITKSMSAYLSEERLDDYGDRLNISIIIRVPSPKYDSLVETIEQVGEKTESKSVNVQDVTEEYIDVEARLKMKKELENRYLEILQQAHTVTDILAVESNLNNVRAEIESMEGRLKYLMSQVSFSTLNLSFYQKLTTDFGLIGRIGDGFKNGWTNLLSFFVGLINVWPFLIIIGGAIWGLARWRKSRKAV